MNNLRNSVQLIGNLGRDPELKELPSGAKVAKVSIAVSDSYRNKSGEFVENTYWFNLVGWEYIAERMMRQMKKGLEVTVQGKLMERSYEDQNGVKKYFTEIRIANFIMMDKQARKSSATAELNVSPELEGVTPF